MCGERVAGRRTGRPCSSGAAGGRHPAPPCAPAAAATSELPPGGLWWPGAAARQHRGARWHPESVVPACPWSRVALLEPQGGEKMRKNTPALQMMQAGFFPLRSGASDSSTARPVIRKLLHTPAQRLAGYEINVFRSLVCTGLTLVTGMAGHGLVKRDQTQNLDVLGREGGKGPSRRIAWEAEPGRQVAGRTWWS